MSEEVEKVENAPEEASDTTPSKDKKSDKPKKSKLRLILLIVVIVVVVGFGAGGGVYLTQHSNPKFCNTLCHTPMNPYVVSYLEGTSINPLQTNLKYPLMVTVHADNDVVCLDCHTDGIGTQISEGIARVTGNFPQPLNPLIFTFGNPEGAHQRDGLATCIVAGCHTGIDTHEDLIALTSNYKRNPHDIDAYNTQGHANDLYCSRCHQSHEQSVLFCTQCHATDFPDLPDGWLSFQDWNKQVLKLGDEAQHK